MSRRARDQIVRGRPPAAGRPALLVAGLVAIMLAVGVASASAAESSIEGVWSFNGGKVAVQAQPDGTFAGTVVAPTKFAQCTHPVGERMWTEMSQQADGSYWGLHQWFFATEACIPNPALGSTAWRVMQTNGSRFLRACFSEPGSNLQPTVAPSGAVTNATFGCVDSALVSSLPEVSKAQFRKYVALPGNRTCFAHKTLRIHMRDPRNDPLKKIVVTLRSGKVHRIAKIKRHDGSVVATLSLKGLPASAFTVTVRLTTVLGDHLSGKRTYHQCVKKKRIHHHG
jgi:hypothetical protein